MHRIKTAIAGILALFVASAAVAQTFPTVPAQSVIGRLGTPGTSGPSQAIPFATLSSRLGVQNLGWFIVGSTQYPTAQSAVDAAAAQNGGIVYFPCGPDVSLGSGSVGLDVSNTTNIRLLGAMSQNSGATSCGAVRYTGTGTMIKADGAIGFEMSNLFAVGLSAAKCLSFDQRATLAAYASVKRNTIYCNQTSGIGISISYAIIATFTENSIVGYIGARGDDEVVGAVANVINFNNNTFLPGNTYHVQNPQGIWSFHQNTFEGGVSGTSIYTTAGALSTCFVLNLTQNDFDDATAVGPANGLVETQCRQINSKGNVWSASPGQTAIQMPNGLGARVSSDGEYLNLAGTFLALGTGNCGEVKNHTAFVGISFILTGTPNGCANPDLIYNYPVFGAGLQSGVAGVAAGSVCIAGSTSGLPCILPGAAAAGTYNFRLPTTAGASGDFLRSGGGGASAMTWLTPGAGVATWLATPSGANLAAALTSALPITKGGTGTTTGAVVRVAQQTFCPSGCSTTIAAGATGTYTPTTGLLYAVVEMCSTGGGGGGAVGTASQTFVGGGGGAGSFTRSVLSAATIGASKVIAIGSAGTGGAAGANAGTAGGDTCLTTTSCASGQIVLAKGGSGGGFSQTGVAFGSGGLGGVAGGNGDLKTPGANGMSGMYLPSAGINIVGVGQGASSQWGGGGLAGNSIALGTGNAGVAATGYCAGGGGGFANAAVDRAGGNGSPGIVWITEYVNQ